MTPLLTIEEICPLLGVSRRQLARLYAELGAVRVGRSVRFTEAGIAAYLARHTVRGTQPERQERPQPRLRALPARSGVGLVTGRQRGTAR